MLDIRSHRSFKSRLRLAEKVIGHADLTDGDTSQVIDLFDLPAGAQVIGRRVLLATAFSGGGNTALSVDVGTTGDPDALIDGADLFTAAVDGEASSVPAGIAPNKSFDAATTIKGTFVCVTGILSGFDAGSCTIQLLYAVPDET